MTALTWKHFPAGPNGFFEGTYPARLLSAFPWAHLQLLQMQLTNRG